MTKNIKRFQVVKVPAYKLGDYTKPTRFGVVVENNKHKDSVLANEQYTLVDSNGKETNAMNNKMKGYIKRLHNPNKKRVVGVGIDLKEVKKEDIISTGKVYSGRNKKLILNHVYNEKDKKTAYQKQVVKNNKAKRKKYKK